jgi:uncharacterized OsmC-like protein
VPDSRAAHRPRHEDPAEEADFDGSGITTDDVDPRMQVFRVVVEADGPSDAEKERLAEAFRTNCPIYTTLAQAAPIELEVP